MARTDNLNNYLTDIATAIKNKKGDQTSISAANFDTEITNLPSGEGNVALIDPFGLDEITLNAADAECPYTLGLIFDLDWYGEGNTLTFNRTSTSDLNSASANYISFSDGEKIPWLTRSESYTKTFTEEMIKKNYNGDRLVYIILYWKDGTNIDTITLGNDTGDNIFTSKALNKISINNINNSSSYNIYSYVNEISGCGNCYGVKSIGENVRIFNNIDYSIGRDPQLNFNSSQSLEKISNVNFDGATLYSTSTNYRGANMKSLKYIENVRNIGIEFYLSNSKKLTKQSLLNILNALVTTEETKTLTLGNVNKARLTEEELAIGLSKGWTIS